MSNKKAVVKIGSDVEEAKKGLNQISSQLNALAKSIKKSDVTRFASSFNAVTGSVKFAVDAIKKVNAVIKETTELYKKQANAEKQLEVAAKNNPYLDSNSVKALKDYASELQSISTVGDEELLPMMAQLVSAGRTQAEIQDIMSAALDVSASGAMTLEGAVKNLNKTFSGLSGELGESIPEIKNLTKEQLKNGEAVKVIASQYKGMAEETAKATGSSEQLKNAISDYKEEVGASFEKNMAPMRRFFTELIQGWTDAKKKKREYEEAKEQNDSGNGTASSLNTEIQGLTKKLNEAYAVLRELEDPKKQKEKIQMGRGYVTQGMLDEAVDNQKKNIKELADRLIDLRAQYVNVKKAEDEEAEAAQKQAEAEKEKAEQIAEEEKLLKKRNELRTEYDEAISKTQTEIEMRRQLGELISEEEENQLLLNAAMASYIKMYSDPAFDRSQTKTGMWEGEQEQRNYIQVLADKAKVAVEIEDLKKKSDEILAEATKYVSKDSDVKLSDSIKTEIESLKQYIENTELSAEQYEALTQRKIELEQLFTEVVKKESEERAQKTKEDVAKVTEVVTNYVDKFAEITNGITSLIRQNNEVENEEAMTALSEQYTNGIISYEEYCEKKKELDKKAAQEEYKLKMWEWTASFLQATANIAQGVAKALAEGGPYAGPILAALIGASGAIQIATIVANKPKTPSFATGGIVQGSSYSGDKVQANVNSGEMILNAQQQANLWKMANGAAGGSGAVVNMPVNIQNNTDASVKTQLNPDGLLILIDKHINAEMAKGTYTQSMNVAQGKAQGASYL